MRVRLHTLGCRLNEAETEAWARQLQARGCPPAGAGEGADLLVVNTCAVTGEALRKSRQLLRRLQRGNPRARLVVTGCAASLPDTDLGAAGIDLLVPNQDKDHLVEIAAAALDLPLMPESATAPAAAALFARHRQRAFVKIQDGCRYQCSFCITTAARGPERSRPLAAICAEVQGLHATGVQEVVLTGVHAAGYGSDHGSSLTDLLAALLEQTSIPRIRLGSVEPWDLPADFWTLFANPRLLPHLHLPLQSGADSVLRRMARRCKGDAYEQLVAQARAAIADFNVTTDIIVGFPGESAAEWQQTLTRCARIGFAQVHIFAYSPRAGTRAATMPDQVPAALKRARSRELHELARQWRAPILANQVGRTWPVLIEGPYAGSDDPPPAGDGAGYTPHYLLTRVRGGADPALLNRIVPVRIDGVSADGSALLATPVETSVGRAAAG
ncbi:MAG: MiaB/RimO family radical SAM methylthiotransferase [Chromatiaceae bacterium]|nr:MAG: MiaB/RimO family radical SAM methylthiotransferase [Chromatiaceae bacterium]